MKIKQEAGRKILGELAPEFAHFNDEVLFGEVWSNPALDQKTRSIITISTFLGRGLIDSAFRSHIENGKKNGISKAEIVSLITQGGFYAGWPVAWAAFNVVKEVYKDVKDEENHGGFFGLGQENKAYEKYFIGKSYLNPISNMSGMSIANVTFEPGCRNNWHVHNAKENGGQILLCVEGEGWYQERGKEAVSLVPGSVINIPANVEHWHGAKKNCWFAHISIGVPGRDASTTWLEEVSDEEYGKLED